MPGIDHIGEDAELYALGALDETAAARVERHARECAQCARRVGEAEETLLRLIPAAGDAPSRRAPRFEPRGQRAGWGAAVAAALLVGLLPWGLERLHSTQPSVAGEAETAMLAGHFGHAPFVALAPGAPRGKLIYALRGGWIYALVAPGRDALEVAVIRAGTRHVVASISPDAGTRSAFVRLSRRADAVELLERGRPIASAAIAKVRLPGR